MALSNGIEPLTSRLTVARSNQLSYESMMVDRKYQIKTLLIGRSSSCTHKYMYRNFKYGILDLALSAALRQSATFLLPSSLPWPCLASFAVSLPCFFALSHRHLPEPQPIFSLKSQAKLSNYSDRKPKQLKHTLPS